MAENLPITVGGEPNGAGDSYGSETEIIGLELDILGKEINFRIAVGQGQARLADIVPLAQAVCTKNYRCGSRKDTQRWWPHPVPQRLFSLL